MIMVKENEWWTFKCFIYWTRIDQVLTELKLPSELLTQAEKIDKIKSKNSDVYNHLIKLVDKGITDSNFDINRKNLVKSPGK